MSDKKNSSGGDKSKKTTGTGSGGKAKGSGSGGSGGGKNDDASDDSKNKLRTSEDVYHRIRWDSSKDRSHYRIGYLDRYKGMREVAFDEYRIGGDIPFHRVYYIRDISLAPTAQVTTSTELTSTGEQVTVTTVVSHDDLGKVSTAKTGTGGTITSTTAKRNATRGEFVWHRELKIDTIFGSGSGNIPVDDGSGKKKKKNAPSASDLVEIADAQPTERSAKKKPVGKPDGPATTTSSTTGSGGSGGGSGGSGGGGVATVTGVTSGGLGSLPNDPFSVYPSYRYNKFDAKWIQYREKAGQKFSHKARQLTILTWNVLFDLYDQDKVRTIERIPELLRLIDASNADIVCLQEVTPPFLTALLGQKWCRDRYNCTERDDPLKMTTVTPYGQIILSKFPFDRVFIHAYSDTKRAVVGSFFINDRSLLVPCIHLTSDNQRSAHEKRMAQLGVITQRLNQLFASASTAPPAASSTGSGSEDNDSKEDSKSAPAAESKAPVLIDVILAGDTNFPDESVYSELIEYVDAWRVVRGSEEAGYTFDPVRNYTTKVTSQSGVQRRMDRVYLRSECWVAGKAELIGTDPIDTSATGDAAAGGDAKSVGDVKSTPLLATAPASTSIAAASDATAPLALPAATAAPVSVTAATTTTAGSGGSSNSDRPPLFPSDHFGLICTLFYSELTATVETKTPAAPTEVIRQSAHKLSSVIAPSATLATSDDDSYFEDTPMHASRRATLKPTNGSSICIIPQYELWPATWSIRICEEWATYRWPVHFNLMYGFIEDDPSQADDFEVGAQLLERVLSVIDPFMVELRPPFQYFEHGQTNSVYLSPTVLPPHPADSLQKIVTLLEQCYPLCRDQSTRSTGENQARFIPHMTVGTVNRGSSGHGNDGKHATQELMKTITTMWNEAFSSGGQGHGVSDVNSGSGVSRILKPSSDTEGHASVRWWVDHICMISRGPHKSGERDFTVRHRVPLGSLRYRNQAKLLRQPSSTLPASFSLMAHAVQHKWFDAPSQQQRKELALRRLRQVLIGALDPTCVNTVDPNKMTGLFGGGDHPKHTQLDHAKGALYTFGSYRLMGTLGSGGGTTSDIDVCVIGYETRDTVFDAITKFINGLSAPASIGDGDEKTGTSPLLSKAAQAELRGKYRRPDGNANAANADTRASQTCFEPLTTRTIRVASVVTDAKVPVLKLVLTVGDGNGPAASVPVDLVYAQYPKSVPLHPPELLSQDIIDTKFTDRTDRLSLGGCRDLSALLQAIPMQWLVPYRVALIAVKQWSKSRGVSSNALGYFGGVSWAVCVAHATLAVAAATSAAASATATASASTDRKSAAAPAVDDDTRAYDVLRQFFVTMSSWSWPKPLALTPQIASGFRSTQKSDLLPVLTPSGGAVNSTRNLCTSTKRVLMSEFQRGAAIVTAAAPVASAAVTAGSGGAAPASPTDVASLWSRQPFFDLYTSYVHCYVQALSKPDLIRCVGWMDSHFIGLVVSLEQRTPNVLLHPYPSYLVNLPRDDGSSVSNYPWTASFFIGLDKASRSPVMSAAPSPTASPSPTVAPAIATSAVPPLDAGAAAAAATTAKVTATSDSKLAAPTAATADRARSNSAAADFAHALDQFTHTFTNQWSHKPNGAVLSVTHVKASVPSIKKAKVRIGATPSPVASRRTSAAMTTPSPATPATPATPPPAAAAPSMPAPAVAAASVAN